MSIISGIAGLTSSEVLALINRGGAEGTAGLYSCKTILNEHRPVCTKEYHLTGKYLDGADNPDVWFPIPGAGGGTVVYSSRFLTLTSGTGAVSASRCVIDQMKFPITGNFLEATCKIGTLTGGVGGGRTLMCGFAPSFSAFQAVKAAFIWQSGDGKWRVACNVDSYKLESLPLGRNLQSGDVVTVRLDRVEGAANINIARFYVNGQKQYESLTIPEENCYAGIGVFSDAATTTAASIAIDYFGCKYVP